MSQEVGLEVGREVSEVVSHLLSFHVHQELNQVLSQKVGHLLRVHVHDEARGGSPIEETDSIDEFSAVTSMSLNSIKSSPAV